MKVLILDSGLRVNHPSLVGIQTNGYSLVFDSETSTVRKIESFEDESGHGTAIYNIIRKKLPDYEIKMIKIFNSELSISEENFYCVLEYILHNENADILNLSLGLNLCTDFSRLYSICKEIRSKGTIIISAFDNNGGVSYPAAIDLVIGVDGAPYISSENEYEWIKSSVINIRAKGSLSRLAWLKPDYIITGGNSFACAFVTAIVAKQLETGILNNSDEVFQKLKNNALRVLEFPQVKLDESLKPSFTIKKAAVFPFNKEMHSIIRFSYMLSFDVTAVYDVKYSGRVGASVRTLLKNDEIPDIIVENIGDISWDSIDTLICGHTDELFSMTNQKNIKDQLLEEALRHNVNVFSFDSYTNISEGKEVFTSTVDADIVPLELMGKMYYIGKPVLGVFGTSSKQGKFTLQLSLRDRLQKKGYVVGQLGSEPSSLLFGMDYAFPFGYNKTVSINGMQSVIFLNDKMQKISQTACDIIIVGSQSGTVPYFKSNVSLYPIEQIDFLYGTSPDAVILAVNPFDELEYIKRTILFIENAVNCKVIGLSLFPMRPRNNYGGLTGSKEPVEFSELCVLKEDLSQKFGVFVGILGNEEDMELMTDNIIEFFSNNQNV